MLPNLEYFEIDNYTVEEYFCIRVIYKYDEEIKVIKEHKFYIEKDCYQLFSFLQFLNSIAFDSDKEEKIQKYFKEHRASYFVQDFAKKSNDILSYLEENKYCYIDENSDLYEIDTIEVFYVDQNNILTILKEF